VGRSFGYAKESRSDLQTPISNTSPASRRRTMCSRRETFACVIIDLEDKYRSERPKLGYQQFRDLWRQSKRA